MENVNKFYKEIKLLIIPFYYCSMAYNNEHFFNQKVMNKLMID